MTHNSQKYISSACRARAELIRNEAWKHANELISIGRIGAAYRHMTNACAEAWRIECLGEY